MSTAIPSEDSTSATEKPCSPTFPTPDNKTGLPNPETPTIATESDTGPISSTWKTNLLQNYTTNLSTIDSQEESLLVRLQAIQKLQLLWATAGRIGEMNHADQRVKTRITKVLLEDEKLSRKRRRLEGVMEALQDVVAKLDDAGMEA